MTDSTSVGYAHASGELDYPQIAETKFEQDVRAFVLNKIETDKDSIITCPSLAAQFLDVHVDVYGELGGWNVAAYIGVAQTIRPLLRKTYQPDPDEVQIDLDLPEAKLLQDRYSVPGAGNDGESAYVPRHRLTQSQMQTIVGRDRAISAHFARRADALESWWHRNNAEAQN